MFFLVLGIACNVALLLIVKSFARFGVEAFPAIVVNYFVAGSFSLLLTTPKSVYLEADHLWLPAALLGIFFISVFYMISLTTEKIGVSAASVANKMSVVIPVILAFLLYGDSITILKITGIILALLSVIFVSSTAKKEKNNSKQNFLLPIAVFIGSGIIDALVNYIQKKIVHSDVETACISGLFFFAAGTFGLLAFILFYKDKKKLDIKKTILAGIILGTPNYFSIYLIMRAISGNIMQSSVLYPIVNVSVVLGSTVIAFLFFAEKLSFKNWMGIALSIAAIALIAGSSS
ncbi:MAG TPA: DMT family transporter [Bacteroidia bacterium]|jgi:drug/metabolite transporter (DMT)-like permease|nr:DMT family transporter [Bacteroidia bacterium]